MNLFKNKNEYLFFFVLLIQRGGEEKEVNSIEFIKYIF